MAQLSGAAAKLDALKWRCIGPPRGGRVVAVAGDPKDRGVFYFGACAGGVWKTIDGGIYWRCVSDGFFGSAQEDDQPATGVAAAARQPAYFLLRSVLRRRPLPPPHARGGYGPSTLAAAGNDGTPVRRNGSG